MALDTARRQLPARALLFTTLLAGAAGIGVTGTHSPALARSPLAARPVAYVVPTANAANRLDVPSPAALQPQAAAIAPAPVAAAAAAAPAPRRVAPAPAPTAAPAPAPVAIAHPAPAPPPPPPAPAPVSYHSRLVSADGSLNTGVGYYGDCSGRTALSHAYAAIDGCIGGRLYFVGHNPGVFSPLMHMGAGSIITFWDGNGTAHRLRIVAVRQWVHVGLPPFPVNGGTVQFQTCITADGSLDRLVDLAPA